jgi:hypothetical protein
MPISPRVEELAQLLAALRDVRSSLGAADLPPESVAAHVANLARDERGTTQLADRLIIVSDLWTLIAADQAAGVAALLRVGDLVFSLFPLCRSIIEHSAETVWVLDPDVSPEIRCARAALAMDKSYETLCAVTSHLAGRGTPAHTEQRRVLKEFRESLEREFPEGTDLAAGIVAGETLATPTEILEHFGGRWGDAREWEGIYEYLCATATHPGVAAFEFFTEHPDGGYLPMMSVDFLERILRATLIPLLKALEHYALYCKWDMTALNEFIDRSGECSLQSRAPAWHISVNTVGFGPRKVATSALPTQERDRGSLGACYDLNPSRSGKLTCGSVDRESLRSR